MWVDDECVEIVNPYIAGTADLNVIRRKANCYSSKPYVCEKPPNKLSAGMFIATLKFFCTLSVMYFF